MLKVGITGGIGSGKSTVCQVFSTLGIPVFYADDAAKFLMEHNSSLIDAIKNIFGTSIYKSNKLDNVTLSTIVFQHPEKLEQLNALVHPATIQYGKDWFTKQTAPYAIKEAAIFFETGSNKDIDVMIGVSAPLELRITRAMHKLGKTREQIQERISRQMDQDEKMKLCDYIITNDEQTAIIPQVIDLHKTLLQKAKTMID